MSMLNRREFKDLLLEWNKNFINERTTTGMKQNLKNIASSNTQILSNYGLDTKMQSLPVLIIDINNSITADSEIFSKFLNAINQNIVLSNHTKKIMDDPDTGDGRTIIWWENNVNTLSALTSILKSFNVLEDNNVSKEDIKNSSIIIFKDASFNADDPYAKEPSTMEKNIYNNALWTLHDVMHRVSEDGFSFNRAWKEKSFELHDNELFQSFFIAVSQAVSHSDDKFKKHEFYSGEDFTPTYIVFLYMYIIEVLNEKVNIKKSIVNLGKFLYSIISKNQKSSSEEKNVFVNIVKEKTQKILEDINSVVEEESYIQLNLYRSWF